MGKFRYMCWIGVFVCALLAAGCGGGGGGSDPSQGTVEIVSGDALNPQADALARRRRIGGTTLKIRFDGDNRPDRPVPLPELIDAFFTLPGIHLAEFMLNNKRGQVIATGRQQTSVLIDVIQTTALVFDLPDCDAGQHVTCRTPAIVTPATVLANVETEQCVSVDDERSPVNDLLICIPPGVLDADTTVAVTEVYNIPSSLPDHLSQASIIVDIQFDPEPFLSQPITLRFPYDEALVATGEQNLGINEAELDLYHLNNRAGQWVPLPGQPPPNTLANTVTAPIDAPGFFVLGGPLPDGRNPPVGESSNCHDLGQCVRTHRADGQ